MVGEDLKHLADAEDPEIVPANPQCNAVFSASDGSAVAGSKIDVAWVAGAAVATHFVHGFTCPVDPAEVAKTEPDGWTSAGVGVLVSAGQIVDIDVSNTGKDYYVALIVGDTDDLATCTVLSGGVGVTCTSG